MRILKRELMEDIGQARDRLDESKIPQFTQEVFRTMEEQCMENASLQDEDNALRREEVLKDFKEGWKYGLNEFKEDLDLIYLTELAGRVEPELKDPGKSYLDIRKDMRMFRGGYVPPADRTRIMIHLERMLEVSKELKDSPLERALFEYFHLIRIQPFFNGNKRTANIVMNSRLKSSGYLPLCISDKKVPEFESYLVGAIDGFKDIGSKDGDVLRPYQNPDFRQLQFYDFLGRKELCGLRCAENQMQGLNKYEISAGSIDRSAMYSLKHQLNSYFSAKNLPHMVKISKDKKRLDITGEIPFRTLNQIVSKVKCKGMAISLKE